MHSQGRSRTPRCSAPVPLAASLHSSRSRRHLASSPLRTELMALRQARAAQQLVPNKRCAGVRPGTCCNKRSVISKEKRGNLQKIQQRSQLPAQTSWAAQPLRSLPKHQGGTRHPLEKPRLPAVLEWKGRESRLPVKQQLPVALSLASPHTPSCHLQVAAIHFWAPAAPLPRGSASGDWSSTLF